MRTVGDDTVAAARKWKATRDKNTGKLYYYHRETKEVQWEKPLGFDEARKEKMAGKVGDDVWKVSCYENREPLPVDTEDIVRDVNHPTILFDYLQQKDWYSALKQLRKNPREAKCWISSGIFSPSHTTWKVLPLHAAIILGAPLELIVEILDKYPNAARRKDLNGSLPIHLAACGIGAYPNGDEIFRHLLIAYPDSRSMKDRNGHTAMKLLHHTQQWKERNARLRWQRITEILSMEHEEVGVETELDMMNGNDDPHDRESRKQATQVPASGATSLSGKSSGSLTSIPIPKSLKYLWKDRQSRQRLQTIMGMIEIPGDDGGRNKDITEGYTIAENEPDQYFDSYNALGENLFSEPIPGSLEIDHSSLSNPSSLSDPSFQGSQKEGDCASIGALSLKRHSMGSDCESNKPGIIDVATDSNNIDDTNPSEIASISGASMPRHILSSDGPLVSHKKKEEETTAHDQYPMRREYQSNNQDILNVDLDRNGLDLTKPSESPPFSMKDCQKERDCASIGALSLKQGSMRSDCEPNKPGIIDVATDSNNLDETNPSELASISGPSKVVSHKKEEEETTPHEQYPTRREYQSNKPDFVNVALDRNDIDLINPSELAPTLSPTAGLAVCQEKKGNEKERATIDHLQKVHSFDSVSSRAKMYVKSKFARFMNASRSEQGGLMQSKSVDGYPRGTHDTDCESHDCIISAKTFPPYPARDSPTIDWPLAKTKPYPSRERVQSNDKEDNGKETVSEHNGVNNSNPNGRENHLDEAQREVEADKENRVNCSNIRGPTTTLGGRSQLEKEVSSVSRAEAFGESDAKLSNSCSDLTQDTRESWQQIGLTGHLSAGEADNPLLFLCLLQQDWARALSRISEHPMEASVWIWQKARGYEMWRLLPLHAAIIIGAPSYLVLAILHAYPMAAKERDMNGSLPIHLAASRMNGPDGHRIVNHLARAFPDSIGIEDGKGRTAIEIARLHNKSIDQNVASEPEEDFMLGSSHKTKNVPSESIVERNFIVESGYVSERSGMRHFKEGTKPCSLDDDLENFKSGFIHIKFND